MSILADNLSECLHKSKLISYNLNLEYITAKSGLPIFNCLEAIKTYMIKFDEDYQRDSKTHLFLDADINKFCVMLEKVYPDGYMDGWE